MVSSELVFEAPATAARGRTQFTCKGSGDVNELLGQEGQARYAKVRFGLE